MLCMLQVLQWVMSYDNENATEALAITAASAALAVSGGPSCLLHEAVCAAAVCANGTSAIMQQLR